MENKSGYNEDEILIEQKMNDSVSISERKGKTCQC